MFKSHGGFNKNLSYSQLHAERAAHAAAQLGLQAKNIREMHRQRRNIELRIHRLEQEKEVAMQVSLILSDHMIDLKDTVESYNTILHTHTYTHTCTHARSQKKC